MSEFADFVRELFAPLGEVRVRRMFGGYGVYRESVMFALIVDEVLYLKADTQTVAQFEDHGLGRFEYLRRGRPVQLSYYMAPEEIFDEPGTALRWGELALAAAHRACRRKH